MFLPLFLWLLLDINVSPLCKSSHGTWQDIPLSTTASTATFSGTHYHYRESANEWTSLHCITVWKVQQDTGTLHPAGQDMIKIQDSIQFLFQFLHQIKSCWSKNNLIYLIYIQGSVKHKREREFSRPVQLWLVLLKIKSLLYWGIIHEDTNHSCHRQ